MEIKKVIVLFKTHLDIGFTDFSENVTQKYMDTYIPGAIRVGKELRQKDNGVRSVWTVGSWLIAEYLRTHNGAASRSLKEAIRNGDIRWHGLPFTTHTELMSPALFRYGLSLAKELDSTFNTVTHAAKMTDVPGHTKAMIPYLKEAGIDFIHFGVNPGSAVPCVPQLFRWQADNGDCVNVMYQDGYGKFDLIGDTGVALYFAHTGDNQGIQNAEEIEKIFADLHAEMPDAEIVAGTLEDVADVVRSIEDTLPVVTDEIGDSWIHGVGTDPGKVAAYRALSRFWETLPESPDRDRLARALIMIPEHTWGLNVHISLADHEHYAKDELADVRGHANYKRMERSWEEQRSYLMNAVSDLNNENRRKAEEILSDLRRPMSIKGYSGEETPLKEQKLGGFTLKFNSVGEIVYLLYKDKVYADSKHKLLSLLYEQFCAADYDRFFTQYNRCDEIWVHEDFTKPGMEKASDCYMRFAPVRANVYNKGEAILVHFVFPKSANRDCGCPLCFDAVLTAEDAKLKIDLAWYDKPANRIAEAIWLGFRPNAQNKRISKMGSLINPQNVVKDGQCRLHATDNGVIYDGIKITPLDSALVALQEPSLLNFTNVKPQDSDPVYFNLYNNVWGTNFPMWYDFDARFRFEITVE